MIFRTPRRTLPFTQISNDLISSPNLSGKAKWILIYLLSKPENWLVYEKDIVRHGKDGRAAIRTGIKELIRAGYAQRTRIRNKKGQFMSYEYRITETPEIPQTVTRDDFPTSDNRTLSNTEYNNSYFEEQKFQRGERGNVNERG